MKRTLKIAGLVLATLVVAGAALADLRFHGVLAGPGSTQWHSVYMQAGRRYKFEIHPHNDDLRVRFRLYRTGPFSLVKEKFANEAEERLGYRPMISGTYWVEVKSLNVASNYRLDLDED